MRRHHSQHGFTLVELMVVIGVISLLVSMLLPALRRAREQAQRVQCMSNLRQIHLAFGFYAGDYKSAYPWTWMWFDYLGQNRYLGRQDPEKVLTSATPAGPRWPILKCPAERQSRMTNWPADIALTEYENNRCSYMWNFSISQYNYSPAGPCRKGFGASVENPGGVAEATFVMDCQVNSYGGDYPMFGWGINDPVFVATYWEPFFVAVFRHPGVTANMLYLDGHVGTVNSPLQGGKPFIWIYNNPP